MPVFVIRHITLSFLLRWLTKLMMMNFVIYAVKGFNTILPKNTLSMYKISTSFPSLKYIREPSRINACIHYTWFS